MVYGTWAKEKWKRRDLRGYLTTCSGLTCLPTFLRCTKHTPALQVCTNCSFGMETLPGDTHVTLSFRSLLRCHLITLFKIANATPTPFTLSLTYLTLSIAMNTNCHSMEFLMYFYYWLSCLTKIHIPGGQGWGRFNLFCLVYPRHLTWSREDARPSGWMSERANEWILLLACS